MNKLLIFEIGIKIGGHHVEYLHHLYKRAIQNSDKEYIFVVPDRFLQVKEDFDWPDSKNVFFDYIPDETISRIDKKGLVGHFFLKPKLLRKYINKHHVSDVLLLSLMNYMPLLPFFLPKGVQCSGIIYIIYMYLWQTSSLLKRLSNVTLYSLFSKLNCFKNVFILNDSSSSAYLNRRYKTTKFVYLPDPIPLCSWNEINIREKYNIPKDAVVFLQCGKLSSRKHCIEILKAADFINTDNIYFIFGGKISSDIEHKFFEIADNMPPKKNVIIINEFLGYDMMYSLLKSCNYVFTLYSQTALSSGVIGYAAYFGKPVIAMDNGLIGKLVKRYHIGYVTRTVDPQILAGRLEVIANDKMKVQSNYVKTHTEVLFSDTLIGS